jgi:dTDP-4-dehydrorhamnose reductase
MAAEQVLLFGAAGQLGHELNLRLQTAGYAVTALSRQQLDFSDLPAVRELVRQCQPRWIINAAAYTAVDKAEQEVQLAQTLNADLPALLAEEAKRLGAALLHYSTDYVFNGRASRPYLETDATDPVSVYGRSKRDGELGLQASGARHLVLRTSWVVGAHGQNFLKTMLRLGAERDVLRVVADQQGAPTSAADLAETLAHIARALACDPDAPTGTFHFSNAGQTTWADFATEIFRLSAACGGPDARIEPIATADYPTPARRPAYSLLSTDRIRTLYGVTPRPWQDAISDIIDELIPSRAT